MDQSARIGGMARQQTHCDDVDVAQQIATAAAIAPPFSCGCMGSITHAAETRLNGGGHVAAASPKAIGYTWRQQLRPASSASATARAVAASPEAIEDQRRQLQPASAPAWAGASLLSLPSELLVVISSSLEDKAAMRGTCRHLRDTFTSALPSLQ